MVKREVKVTKKRSIGKIDRDSGFLRWGTEKVETEQMCRRLRRYHWCDSTIPQRLYFEELEKEKIDFYRYLGMVKREEREEERIFFFHRSEERFDRKIVQ